jgi:predicted sulfurtransferase
MRVTELVHYGLDNSKAPPQLGQYQGTHLEPRDYHEMLAADNTVVIDVRNHYEAAIGRFNPPPNGAEFLDPHMRKSTEFPVWLDNEETKERLRNKQVLMYCTGTCYRQLICLPHFLPFLLYT